MKTNKARVVLSPLISHTLEALDPIKSKQIENQMEISARIDDVMRAKNISKSELALKLSKHPSEITKWLSGTHNFTIDTISMLEVALNERLLTKVESTPIIVNYTRNIKIRVPQAPLYVKPVMFITNSRLYES